MPAIAQKMWLVLIFIALSLPQSYGAYFDITFTAKLYGSSAAPPTYKMRVSGSLNPRNLISKFKVTMERACEESFHAFWYSKAEPRGAQPPVWPVPDSEINRYDNEIFVTGVQIDSIVANGARENIVDKSGTLGAALPSDFSSSGTVNIAATLSYNIVSRRGDEPLDLGEDASHLPRVLGVAEAKLRGTGGSSGTGTGGGVMVARTANYGNDLSSNGWEEEIGLAYLNDRLTDLENELRQLRQHHTHHSRRGRLRKKYYQ